MNRKDLREHLKGFYGRDRVRRPVRVLAEFGERTPPRPRGPWDRSMAWLAGGFALILLGLTGWLDWAQLSSPPGGPSYRGFAEDLSIHHHKQFGVEVPTDDFKELRRRMDRLGFTLVIPEFLTSEPARLLGGRYCAFQGNTLAQIHLTSPQGTAWTLFEMRPPRPHEHDLFQEFIIDGLEVRIWFEGGLLMGLARPKI